MKGARELWTSGSTVPARVDAEEIARKARAFGRRAAISNAAEYVAGVVVIGVFLAYAFVPGFMPLPVLSRVGSVLIAAGTIVVLRHLWRRGGGGAAEVRWGETTLEAYRLQLVRRRDLSRSVLRWYIGPFMPGLVVFLLGICLDERARRGWPAIVATIVACTATCVSIAMLNRRAARKLDAEIAALPPGDGR